MSHEDEGEPRAQRGATWLARVLTEAVAYALFAFMVLTLFCCTAY